MARLDLPPSTLTGPLRNYLEQVQKAIRGLQSTSGWTNTSSDFTLTGDYYRLRVKSTGTVNVYLPSATPFESWTYQVKLTPDSTGTIRIIPQAGQVVEGGSLYSIVTAGWNITLQSYQTGWDVQ